LLHKKVHVRGEGVADVTFLTEKTKDHLWGEGGKARIRGEMVRRREKPCSKDVRGRQKGNRNKKIQWGKWGGA